MKISASIYSDKNRPLQAVIKDIEEHQVDLLHVDPSYAESKLNWKPKTSLEELVKIMVDYDIKYDGYGFD